MKCSLETKIFELRDKKGADMFRESTSDPHFSSPTRINQNNIIDSDLPAQTKVRVKLTPQTSAQVCYLMDRTVNPNGSFQYVATTLANDIISFNHDRIIEVVISFPHMHGSPKLSPPRQPFSPPHTFHEDANINHHSSFNGFRGLREDEFSVQEANEKVIRKVKEYDLLSVTTLPGRLVPLSSSNGQEFYSALRLELASYNIPLVDWNNICSVEDIVDLYPSATGNLVSAKRLMARALYKFLDNHKETLERFACR